MIFQTLIDYCKQALGLTTPSKTLVSPIDTANYLWFDATLNLLISTTFEQTSDICLDKENRFQYIGKL